MMTTRPTIDELRARVAYNGKYAGTPGKGPTGRTCKSCAHKIYSAPHKAKHPKCNLAQWTSGDATTIKTSTPACEKYKEDL